MYRTVAGSSLSRGSFGVEQLLVVTGTVHCPSTSSAWDISLNSKACPKMSRSYILLWRKNGAILKAQGWETRPVKPELWESRSSIYFLVHKRDNLQRMQWRSISLFTECFQISGWKALPEDRLVVLLTNTAGSSHTRTSASSEWVLCIPCSAASGGAIPCAATPCMRFPCREERVKVTS